MEIFLIGDNKIFALCNENNYSDSSLCKDVTGWSACLKSNYLDDSYKENWTFKAGISVYENTYAGYKYDYEVENKKG